MKRERIEKLAVDYAAGELNEDGQVLFKMYLAEHPEENRWAKDIMRIYEKTKAAIDAKTMDSGANDKRPFIKKNRLLLLKFKMLGHSAAAVVLGTLIGFSAGRWGITDKMNRATLMEAGWAPRQVKTTSDLKEKYAGTFWGNKVLALLEHTPGQRHKADFQDIEFWYKYRQYIEEKRYE